MAIIFGESGEHGIAPGANIILGGGGATSALVNRKIWDAQTSGASLALETTTVPPGAASCFKIPSTVAAAANITRTFSDNTFCYGFWFRKIGSTNPSAVNPRIVGFNPSNHTIRLSSGGVLQITIGNASPQTLNTPSADTWYWITGKIDTSSGTHTHDAKIYDDTGSLIATATQSTGAIAAAAQTSFILGTGGSMGGASCFVGTLILSDAHADYPILPMGTDLLLPNACGTHSFTAGDFVDDTATNLGTSETTSWQKLDEIPPNTTDYVQQNVDNANGYVEYAFDDVDTAGRSLGDVSFVQLIAAHRPTTTGANLVGQKLNDGGTITAEATIDHSLTANTLEYGMHGYSTRPNGGTAWDTTSANALKARFGYMTLQPAQAGLSAYYIQVFAPISAGGPTQFNQALTATQGSTATFVKQAGKIFTISQNPAETILKQVGKPLTTTQASTASLAAAKTILQALTATVGKSVTMLKQVGKNVTATEGSTATFQKQVGKLFVITQTPAKTLLKQVNKLLSTTQGSTASLLTQKVFLVTMSATSVATATMLKQVGKIVSTTEGSTATFVKQVGKALTVTKSSTATIIKQATKTLSATEGSTATMLKQVGKPLVVGVTSVATFTKRVGKLVSATSTLLATLTKIVFTNEVLSQRENTLTLETSINTLTLSVSANVCYLESSENTMTMGQSENATTLEASENTIQLFMED